VTHRGKRWRKSLASRSEAYSWAEEAERLVKAGGDPEGSSEPSKGGLPTTLGELLEHTMAAHWKGTQGERTAVFNATEVVSLIGSRKPLKKLTAFDIDKLVLDLQAKGNTNGTINRKLAALSKMLSVGLQIEAIDKKPHIRRLKEAVHRIRTFSKEEEQHLIRFFRVIGQEEMIHLVILGIDTGMRKGEMLRLKAKDIQGGRISVWMTKANRPRHIPMTARVKTMLEGWAAKAKPNDAFFTLSEDSVQHYWLRARSHMGMDDDNQFVIHTLRHTFCSRLAAAGVDARSIMELAGHSALTVTQRYMHAFAPVVEDAIRKLEAC